MSIRSEEVCVAAVCGKEIVVVQVGFRLSLTVSVRPTRSVGTLFWSTWQTRKGSERERKSLFARLRAEKRSSI